MSRLTKISKGPADGPWSIAMHGADGSGKTTFGLACPAPIFMKLETKDDELDDNHYTPVDWNDACGFVEDLHGTHDYQTLVIDTADWLNENMTEPFVVKKHNWTSMQDKKAEFGRGSDALLDEWRVLMAKLELLRIKRRMNVLILAHSEVRRFNDPDGDDYDRFEMKMPKKVAALIREACKAVFFACIETSTTGDFRKKGQTTGKHIMYTRRRAALDAKNPWSLPAIMPLSFQEFDSARRNAGENLKTEFEERLGALDTEKRQAFDAWWNQQPNKTIAMAQAVNHWRTKEEEAA